MNRRTVIASGAAFVAVAAVGVVVLRPDRLLRKHYPPTPYDDLLALLPDRESAQKIGRAFLGEHSNFTSAAAARALHQHLAGRTLGEVTASEVSSGQVVEAGRWVMPETVVGLCALAARS